MQRPLTQQSRRSDREPTIIEVTAVIRRTLLCMPNWKAGGRDSLPAELLKYNHPDFFRYFRNLLENVWRTGGFPQQLKDATNK